jgi:hypothetical protein
VPSWQSIRPLINIVTNCTRVVFAIAVLLGASRIAAAQDPGAGPAKRTKAERNAPRPAPPIVIPQELSPPQEAYASFPEHGAAAAPSAPSACQLRLSGVAAFHPLPVLIGPGECGAVDAVQLEAVILPDQTKVPLAPAATLRCTIAEAVAHWVREDVVPAAVKLGAPLRGLDNFDSYECRGRNRVRGATLSEHGRANALDVRGFKLANGKSVELTDVKVAKEWREGIRAGVCARFSTVLGPGSDGAHEEHIHLDLAERRGNYKLCEWDVRVPVAQADETGAPEDAQSGVALAPENIPLPRPRPHTM